MDKRDEILKIFSLNLRRVISSLELDYEKLQEIRLRVNGPLIVIYDNKEYFITKDSNLVNLQEEAYLVSQNEIRETMEYISNYSMYAFEDEIKQGFITIQGGHRIGIAGKTILENDKIKNIKHISFINIRLSHQIKGCASKVLPFIMNGTEDIFHTLIISPPRCGKTTLLRDVIRQLSNGHSKFLGQSVGVIDERSEIGACYMGVPQNELGIRTDILDCCPKANGMMMLIRSMSPRIIAVDEVGSKEDIEAIEYVINCGCKLIATVHGSSIDDIKTKPILGRLVREKIFERYIVLNNRITVGNVEEIYDARGSIVYKSGV
ncbi:stage III sporulation protein AA [Anaeromicropila herbilytica]|uniref:Stage III sporulation protein AA n=1 Tax=Anaeromicropila herbilytica TaxID=2785025 RepID=A0A7R7EKS1_9FIRM|nr:stage III sporulation protein AA [Anaeromicropila herbilytica]BCN30391.1 stage III sporulation protein AA [Anaeromicropila herbilytica]